MTRLAGEPANFSSLGGCPSILTIWAGSLPFGPLEDPSAEYVAGHPPITSALDPLSPVHLAFRLSLAPWRTQRPSPGSLIALDPLLRN
jgi:hypothetical protein